MVLLLLFVDSGTTVLLFTHFGSGNSSALLALTDVEAAEPQFGNGFCPHLVK